MFLSQIAIRSREFDRLLPQLTSLHIEDSSEDGLQWLWSAHWFEQLTTLSCSGVRATDLTNGQRITAMLAHPVASMRYQLGGSDISLEPWADGSCRATVRISLHHPEPLRQLVAVLSHVPRQLLSPLYATGMGGTRAVAAAKALQQLGFEAVASRS